jgi:hypothetical protein
LILETPFFKLPARLSNSLYSRIRSKIRELPLLGQLLWWIYYRFIPATIAAGWDVLRFLFAPCRYFGPVKGSYSDLELLRRSGEKEGRIILLDQGNPVAGPESAMVLCKRKQHLQQPFPVFWRHLGKVRLIGPGLAQINDLKQVSVDAVMGSPYLKSDPAYQFFIRGEPVRLEGPWTSVVSRWMQVSGTQAYGHWLLDCLPRLAVLKEFPAETSIIVPSRRTRYQVESLELLGLSDRCRWTHETYLEVEDYYFSSPPSPIACYSPYTVKVMQEMFWPLKDKRPTPKRFFVRRVGTSRNMTNESAVLEFFEKAGWTIVDFAGMPFAEQVAWFANAEAVAGIHGSGITNTLFCPPGCKVFELFSDQYIAGDAEWIAQCTGAEHHALIFPSDKHCNAIVDLNRVRASLESSRML